MAPPISPSEIPNAFPIASKAIPIVAMVDQELPVAKEMIAQIIEVATRNIFGFRNKYSRKIFVKFSFFIYINIY